ncbi:MAG: glycerate kinase [Bacteroidales bacterium]|nr:glycerate kinase [Bacteroidales bacterium]
MKVIVAPDSFKGCLSSQEVASTLASALRGLHPDWEVVEFPLADGGEGTVDVLTPALGGEFRLAVVSDPLGRPVTARYGLLDDTAIIEVAEACGLKYLEPEERNPLIASTYGVGELLMAAHGEGARHFVIGLGGTATCDGGAGMLQVTGLREAMKDCTIELLCDVEIPFIGPEGAVQRYAPQKGASAEDLEILEERMKAFAGTLLSETGVDVLSLPSAGAAGGLAGAFTACFGAATLSGIDRILDLTGFDAVISDADLVITGEGKSDLQTLSGKVALGVLRRVKDIPVFLVSGRIENESALSAEDFSKLIQVSPEDLPLEEAMKPEIAKANLRKSAERI